MTRPDAISPEEIEAGKRNWARMPEDMREFFAALVAAGFTDNNPPSPLDGRRALANARVAIHPETLPRDGVVPCLPTREERLVLEEIQNRGKRK